MAQVSDRNSHRRGLLIVVEGLDRSGKTTQCQKLVDSIAATGKEVKYVKFPDRSTATGQLINTYLQGTTQQEDHAIHLLFSANRWEAIDGLTQALQSGTTLVMDRYSFSGAVYSAAKNNPRLSLEWAWSCELGLLKPDLVLFLNISAEDAAKRGGYGEERYEKEEIQSRVRALFNDLFARLPEVKAYTIDAGVSVGEVADQIMEVYLKHDSTNSGTDTELDILGGLQTG